MAFLSKSDFITIISVPALDILTGGDDNIIDTMITEILLEMLSYINNRYNLSIDILINILAHPTMQMYGKDMVLYHLFSRHHHRPMPEIRAKRYEQALQWLREVQKGNILPFDFSALIDDIPNVDLVASGSNDPRTNQQE